MLVDAQLQGTVVRNADSFIEFRVRIEANVRNSQSHVAGGVPDDESLQVLSGKTVDLPPVRVVLLERTSRQCRILRRRNLRLIERQRNYAVDSMISHVGHAEQQRIHRLPLKVQSPIFGIWKFVFGVVATEEQRATPTEPVSCAEGSGIVGNF